MSKTDIKAATVTLEMEDGALHTVKLSDMKLEALRRAAGYAVHEAGEGKSMV